MNLNILQITVSKSRVGVRSRQIHAWKQSLMMGVSSVCVSLLEEGEGEGKSRFIGIRIMPPFQW